ncbi:MAG: peptidase C69 [Deltaproteobacteria bacterium GWC2_55_46]|nr:MAG: peptidase C69 [Deltaproteobacteria bacterium GWA2_55_82]OGQ62828.1 MAG: peptidase C69 [Deltaproteobacteria bacterium RIFCSPLOWO2_02_FULL_55_12]OIJ75043.1 MAG: peptidase C69 [Deltaproteobacteria bacterium GWC2_55_46]
MIENFDPFKVLKAALKKGGEYADIYLEDTANASIVAEEKRIEKVITGRDRGCGIRVIAGLKTYFAYTNDVSEKGLIEAASAVAHGVRDGKEAGAINLKKKETAPGFDIKRLPYMGVLEEKVGLVNRAADAAWKFDKRIRQVRVVYGDGWRRMAVVNSLGEWIEEDRNALLFLCNAISAEGDVIQTGYEPLGGIMGLEAFDETPPEAIAETAARRAIMMLGARRAPGGKMAVVLSSEAGGTMVHEAVGHGLEADLALQNLSVYSGKIGQKVANEKITVLDDSTLPYRRGSFFFDDEGTPAEKTVLIENGVLKTYMCDRLNAMKSGFKSTGNGRRESYQHRPIPRMTNTIIAPGTEDPDTIVRSLDKGLFVKKMGGGQVNTVNGDFVFEVTEGYMIEKGKIGEPVRGATLTGNGPDVLMNIDMLGRDLGFGIGTCGKDSQGVPVSDAQPTLRIPEITVGGKAK